jgi:hypothetical protein
MSPAVVLRSGIGSEVVRDSPARARITVEDYSYVDFELISCFLRCSP